MGSGSSGGSAAADKPAPKRKEPKVVEGAQYNRGGPGPVQPPEAFEHEEEK